MTEHLAVHLVPRARLLVGERVAPGLACSLWPGAGPACRGRHAAEHGSGPGCWPFLLAEAAATEVSGMTEADEL